MRGYFALPQTPHGGGIVLGSSIWGINSDLRAVADGYAALGYAVVAPNLFWCKTSIDGTEYDVTKFDTVVKFADTGSDPDSIDDMRRAKAELTRRSPCTRFAAIGWCYGGRIACLEMHFATAPTTSLRSSRPAAGGPEQARRASPGDAPRTHAAPAWRPASR